MCPTEKVGHTRKCTHVRECKKQRTAKAVARNSRKRSKARIERHVHFAEPVVCEVHDALLAVHAFVSRTRTPVGTVDHTKLCVGVVDSGNAKRHVLKNPAFFPHGYKVVEISVTGVNGAEKKRVGIGPSVLILPHASGRYIHESAESVYMPECPCNLLCQNAIERKLDGSLSGIECRYVKERIELGDGVFVPMPLNRNSGLYTVSMQACNRNETSVAPRCTRPNFRFGHNMAIIL